MLEYTIDKKEIITVNGEKIVDLTDSIFKTEDYESILFNIYRVPEHMKMRMDLVSIAAYGTDKYTEVLLKYNSISNPFTLNADDILFVPTIDTVENELKANQIPKNDTAEQIRNYHKYIDKNKLPNNIGSQKNDKKIAKGAEFKEANIAGVNQSGITLRNGRIYFGDNNVACASEGITASDFNLAKIENMLSCESADNSTYVQNTVMETLSSELDTSLYNDAINQYKNELKNIK